MNTHVIVVGGIAINDKEHDIYPWAFLNAASARMSQHRRGNKSILIMYTPNYEKRVTHQKPELEHPDTDKTDKNIHRYKEKMIRICRDKGFNFIAVRTAKELHSSLKSCRPIETLEYFGHSDKNYWFLDYTMPVADNPDINIGRDKSAQYWGLKDAKDLGAAGFTKSGLFISYGCRQGQRLGLCHAVAVRLSIRGIGSEIRTNYEVEGWIPRGEFYEYNPKISTESPTSIRQRVSPPFQ